MLDKLMALAQGGGQMQGQNPMVKALLGALAQMPSGSNTDTAQYASGKARQMGMSPDDPELMGMVNKAVGETDNAMPSGDNPEGGEMPEHEWEGGIDGVPTQRDLMYLNQYPTDGVINDFIKTFPTWYDQQMQAGGGKGRPETGDHAISEEELEETYAGRKTQIDDR